MAVRAAETLIALLVLLAGTTWFSGQATACSCADSDIREHFLKAAVVFEGRVTSTRTRPYRWDNYGTTLMEMGVATLEIDTLLKGRKSEQIEISFDTSSSCATFLPVGARMLVFAYGTVNGYTTGQCTPTRILDEGETIHLPDDYSTRRRSIRNSAPVKTALAWVLKEGLSTEERERALNWLIWRIKEQEAILENKEFLHEYLNMISSLSEEIFLASTEANFFDKWQDPYHAGLAYELALEKRPDNLGYRIEAGRRMLKAGVFERARTHFSEALKLDPDNTASRLGLAKTRLVLEGRLTPGHTNYRDIEGAALDLSNQQVDRLDLSGTRFSSLDLSGSQISNLKLVSAVSGESSFNDAQLHGARFDGYGTSENTDFSGAELHESVFAHSNLHGTNFADTQLYKADFSHANATRVQFTGAVARRVRFRNANLENSNFSGADFSSADLAGAKLDGVRIDCTTRLPEALDIRNRQIIPTRPVCNGQGQNRNFSHKRWDYVRFGDLDLKRANFENANLIYVDFYKSDLEAADFSGTSGIARFSDSNLTQAQFRDATLRARFHGHSPTENAPGPNGTTVPPANLTGTNFTDTDLETEYFLGRSILIWETPLAPPADISNAIFRRAKLSCDSGDARRTVENFESGKFREGWYYKNVAEQQGDNEGRLARLEEDYRKGAEAAREWLARENAMVTSLNAKWPSMTFDETCAAHFDAPEAE